MALTRGLWRFAIALALAGVPGAVVGAQPAPKIAKPTPAPADIPSNVAPLPPAQFDSKLAIQGQDVKAKEIDTRLGVEVHINGQGPYRFIVDSGADTSAVSVAIATDLKLPLASPAILNGMTGRDLVDRVKVDRLTLGPTTITNLELPALRAYNVGADGIIGIDALTEKRLLMDFEKKFIKIEDASVHYTPLPGEIVVTARRRRGQLILTHVYAAGQPIEAVIDTGTEITIGNLALRDKLIHGNSDKFIDMPIIGVTGVSQTLQVAKIGRLELGPITLTDVPMAFADLPPFKLFGLSDEPAILLGTDVLETFRRISLDFRARKVRFQLRKCKPEGVIIDTDPNNFSRLSSTGTQDVCGDG